VAAGNEKNRKRSKLWFEKVNTRDGLRARQYRAETTKANSRFFRGFQIITEKFIKVLFEKRCIPMVSRQRGYEVKFAEQPSPERKLT